MLLKNFLQSISYVGFTDGINMEQVSQVLRRIYKEPEEVETDQLLPFLVTLAVSNARYNDFDLKSRNFIDRALDLIEERFTGTKQLPPEFTHAIGAQDLFLFNQIPSQRKQYNKILDLNTLSSFEQASQSSDKSFFQDSVDNRQDKRFKQTSLEEDAIEQEKI